MAIKRVGHVVLKLRDLDKARQFYVDFLGMKIGESGSYTAPNGKDIQVEIMSAKPYAG